MSGSWLTSATLWSELRPPCRIENVTLPATADRIRYHVLLSGTAAVNRISFAPGGGVLVLTPNSGRLNFTVGAKPDAACNLPKGYSTTTAKTTKTAMTTAKTTSHTSGPTHSTSIHAPSTTNTARTHASTVASTGGSSAAGAAAGGAIGGAVLLLLLVLIVLRARRKSRGLGGPGGNGAITFTADTLAAAPNRSNTVLVGEISRDRLVVQELIGSGWFAEVHKGQLTTDAGERKVAVKRLKADANEHDRTCFAKEIEVNQLVGSHKFIVAMLGFVRSSAPWLIVLELLEQGNLRDYLRRCRQTPRQPQSITLEEQLTFAGQIAQAMQHLESRRIVHGDLAARNVLVGSHGQVCKVADFGLSEDVYSDNEFRGAKQIAWRWSAIEAIRDRVLTSKSDVWSYGVTLWEIASLGASPYPGIDNNELLTKLETGMRLECPPGCPTAVHRIMLACFEAQPEDRPSFNQLHALVRVALQRDVNEAAVPSAYLAIDRAHDLTGLQQAAGGSHQSQAWTMQDAEAPVWDDGSFTAETAAVPTEDNMYEPIDKMQKAPASSDRDIVTLFLPTYTTDVPPPAPPRTYSALSNVPQSVYEPPPRFAQASKLSGANITQPSYYKLEDEWEAAASMLQSSSDDAPAGFEGQIDEAHYGNIF